MIRMPAKAENNAVSALGRGEWFVPFDCIYVRVGNDGIDWV